MLHITMDMAVKALREAVKEKGSDYVYQRPSGMETCAYVHGNALVGYTAGCGVGDALIRLGVPMRYLLENNVGTGVVLLTRAAEAEEVFTIDQQARSFLSSFQEVQDDEVATWGEALSHAEEHWL